MWRSLSWGGSFLRGIAIVLQTLVQFLMICVWLAFAIAFVISKAAIDSMDHHSMMWGGDHASSSSKDRSISHWWNSRSYNVVHFHGEYHGQEDEDDEGWEA